MAEEKIQSSQLEGTTFDSAKDLETRGEIDHVAEKKLLRKIDLHIMPFVMLLYMFSFLDRVNIGNARLYGLEANLGLQGNQFQIGVSMLFVTYILSEIPSNLVLKKVGPSRWIAFITTVWGIVATLTGVTQNLAGLVVCRLFLGLAEGGLFPGLAVYLTLFYTRRELALRIGYLFASGAISGAVGGLLAYLISFLDQAAGLRGWRWIFIIEGLPTVVLGVLTWFVLADDPATAYYLNNEERALVIVRAQRQAGYSQTSSDFHKSDVIKGVRDWKIWVFAGTQFCAGIMLYGYTTFLPTIIASLGQWTAPQANALTIPCYVLGAVTYITSAWLSDRYQMRGIFPVCAGIICIVGYGVLISNVSSTAHYVGCLLVGMGVYVFLGIPLAWLPMNQPRYGKRTFATGLQLTLSNVGGVFVPFLYTSNFAPRNFVGHGFTMGVVGVATIGYASMTLYFAKRNRDRKSGKEDYKMDGKTDEEIAEMGDESPLYTFTR